MAKIENKELDKKIDNIIEENKKIDKKCKYIPFRVGYTDQCIIQDFNNYDEAKAFIDKELPNYKTLNLYCKVFEFTETGKWHSKKMYTFKIKEDPIER